MSFDLPPFLRHRIALHRVHRALERNDPFSALAQLSEPALGAFATSEDLRRRALALLARGADEAHLLGDEVRRAAILEFWAGFDPLGVEAWRTKHARAAAAPPAIPAVVAPFAPFAPPLASDSQKSFEGVAPADESHRPRLQSLLAEMRTRSARSEPSTRDPVASSGGTDRPRVEDASASTHTARFRLAVDDTGEYLVVVGTSFTLGHARSRTVDLPFLADLETAHARFELVEGFHAGPRWCLRPSKASPTGCAHPTAGGPDGSVSRAGDTSGLRAGDTSGLRAGDTSALRAGDTSVLRDGDIVRLAQNLVFRWSAADPSSSSVVVELLHGAECLGASRLLLLVPGPEGRVRLGDRRTRQIKVSGLAHEIALEVDDSSTPYKLVVTCSGRVDVRGADGCERTPAGFAVPCPPQATVQFAIDARVGTRAPFGIVLVPLDPSPQSGSGPT